VLEIHRRSSVSKGENFVFIAIVLLFAIVAAAAGGKASVRREQNKMRLGEGDVKHLLLLMDTDRNCKISRQEYINFMAAQFDRLDKDKSGELDPKELTQSQLRVSHFANVGK
jgi:Ca2+-binding EF-hand superfamily protein